ncbi:MAG: DUF2905 domain-containing protein [Alphaproteobacteria bacterium]|nr:DUF2905 domain-containing protein [Alphaproteobacteria bacterium]
MEPRRILVVAGLLLVAAGLAWPWLARLPLGRLPGDIAIHRENVRFYFPLATCLVISVVLTLLFWALRK